MLDRDVEHMRQLLVTAGAAITTGEVDGHEGSVGYFTLPMANGTVLSVVLGNTPPSIAFMLNHNGAQCAPDVVWHPA